MLHKEVWVTTFYGTQLKIQNRKIIKFSGRDISSLAAKGLIWVTKIYSSATCGTQVIRTIKDLNSQTVYDMKRYFNQMVSQNQPNTHTTLFWHPYDIVLTLWTLYGHRNEVVCLLGSHHKLDRKNRIKTKSSQQQQQQQNKTHSFIHSFTPNADKDHFLRSIKISLRHIEQPIKTNRFDLIPTSSHQQIKYD